MRVILVMDLEKSRERWLRKQSESSGIKRIQSPSETKTHSLVAAEPKANKVANKQA